MPSSAFKDYDLTTQDAIKSSLVNGKNLQEKNKDLIKKAITNKSMCLKSSIHEKKMSQRIPIIKKSKTLRPRVKALQGKKIQEQKR